MNYKIKKFKLNHLKIFCYSQFEMLEGKSNYSIDNKSYSQVK